MNKALRNGSNAVYSGNGTAASNGRPKPVLITGGAGFIGTNLAHRLLTGGQRVLIFDTLARPGVEKNLNGLCKLHKSLVDVETADVRDPDKVRRAVTNASQVFHFAAQVAVTTSLDDPMADFEVNARGTLNILEAARGLKDPPPLVFTSTNKVYGALDGLVLEKKKDRYQPASRKMREHGISEAQRIDFHSPYGCSKGAADQYVLDYARTFNLPAVVFRMSCIYGPHQCGTEDQGWMAHFLINVLEDRPVTIFGDGMQVRDVLYADDLVDAFQLAIKNLDKVRSQAFNIGGGADNAVGLLEVLEHIGRFGKNGCKVHFADWRAADQKYYVSDTRKFQRATGWRPKTNVQEGLEKLHNWLTDSRLAKTSVRRVKTGQSFHKEAAGGR